MEFIWTAITYLVLPQFHLLIYNQSSPADMSPGPSTCTTLSDSCHLSHILPISAFGFPKKYLNEPVLHKKNWWDCVLIDDQVSVFEKGLHLCPVDPQHFLVHIHWPQVAGTLCGVWWEFPTVSLLVVSQFMDGTPHAAFHTVNIDQLMCCSCECHDGITCMHPTCMIEDMCKHEANNPHIRKEMLMFLITCKHRNMDI